MTEGGADHGHDEARAMLDAFASVGASAFDLTITTRSEEKETFRRGVRLADLRRDMPSILDHATRRERNVIVRPHGSGVCFIQLDDLKADMLARLAPAVFLILQTSPANFQAWVAVAGAEDKDFARRLRKGTGADATASGATRVAGSLNFKDKYAPDFPRVRIEQAALGRKATHAELDQLGLVAAREAPPRPSPARSTFTAGPRAWPDYNRCLKGAPMNHAKTGPDVSRADFLWCKIAIQWGWSADATAAYLMELSPKAQERGAGVPYAVRTAEAAALAVARENSPASRSAYPAPKQG